MAVLDTSLSEWVDRPPETLVIGDGPYAKVLAFILGSAPLASNALPAGPSEYLGGCPRVFEELKRCILVVSESMTASDALRDHDLAWQWVESLSSVREMHDLAFVFIVPQSGSSTYEEALAVGLTTTISGLAASGYGVFSQSGTLSDLLKLLSGVTPTDLQTHRARRWGDSRRMALARLHAAVINGPQDVVKSALQGVRTLFHGQEFHLDLYCRPPSHRNGNLFRTWLMSNVAEDVTPDWWNTGRIGLREWLQDNLPGEPL